MLLFGILIVPFVTTFVLFFFFKHKIVWWEIMLPFGVSLILLVVIYWADFLYQTTDSASKAVFIEEVVYEEEWDEEIVDVCYSTECDENGNNCREVSYSCKKVIVHPELFYARTSHGKIINLSKIQFEKFQRQFKHIDKSYPNRKFYSIEGAIYSSVWQQDTSSAIIYGEKGYYVNKLKAADQSVFFEEHNFSESNSFDSLLYPIEKTLLDFDSKVIFSPWESHKQWNHQLNYLNASFNETSGIQVVILIYQKQPKEIALAQQASWQTGKRNQFVITIGMEDSLNVKWCRVFSWTENEALKNKTRNFIIDQKELVPDRLLVFLNDEIAPNFVIKDFNEFAYLSVSPKGGTLIFAYILIFIVSIAVTVWCIVNSVY